MANAKLHVICGNCGCNNSFTFKIDFRGRNDNDGNDYAGVNIICENCSTLHSLEDNAVEKNEASINKKICENMQYYMEYCEANGYVTPMEYLTEHKHF